jgi:hypothetical protein
MKRVFAFIFLWISNILLAADAGDAQKALNTSPHELPGFITDNPGEVSFNDPDTLNGAQANHEGTHFFKESLEKRPFFRIYGKTDSLIQSSQEIHQNKESIVRGGPITYKKCIKETINFCVEGKATVTVTCTETLMTGVHTSKKKTYIGTLYHGWSNNYWSYWGYTTPNEVSRCVFRYFDGCNWWDSWIEQRNLFEINVNRFDWSKDTVQESGWRQVNEKEFNDFNEHVDAAQDHFVSSCPSVSQRCKLQEKICVSRLSEKSMEGSENPITFTRPCFQYEVKYLCQGSTRQECTQLRKKGCVQTKSRCLKSVNRECFEWRQKMRCPEKYERVTQHTTEKTGSWAVDNPLTYEPNHEMKEAIATLAIFNEMKKDTGTINPQIFKGSVGRCTKAFANFKNCCHKPSGWGVDLNLSGCNSEDLALSQKRSKALCVHVGTFCAEKALGVCIRKKTSYCCFDSKLSRIFHEQGRRQLGIGWGSGAHPECRGLTIEELQKIDFSKIDLREIHEEIVKNIKIPDVKACTQGLKDRLTQMTRDAQSPRSQGGL